MVVQRKLKGLIAEYEIDQSTLAKVLGVTRETINNKINGKVSFSLAEAVKIANYFKKDINEIFLLDEFTLSEPKAL